MMKALHYCLNASTIRGTPIMDQIQIASDAGYDAVELWYADVDVYLAGGGRRIDIFKAVDGLGMEVATAIYHDGWFDCAEEDWPRVKDDADRLMLRTASLGTRQIIFSPPRGRADLATGARRFAELLEVSKDYGVRPVFEFLGFVEQYNTIESALEVLALAGGGEMVLDPFHIFRGGGSVESIAKLRPEQIAVAHFNDIVTSVPREQQGDGDRVMPGDGTFDLRRYCDLLRGTGYRGYLSLELFREDLWARDPREVARIGLEKMRAVVEG